MTFLAKAGARSRTASSQTRPDEGEDLAPKRTMKGLAKVGTVKVSENFFLFLEGWLPRRGNVFGRPAWGGRALSARDLPHLLAICDNMRLQNSVSLSIKFSESGLAQTAPCISEELAPAVEPLMAGARWACARKLG